MKVSSTAVLLLVICFIFVSEMPIDRVMKISEAEPASLQFGSSSFILINETQIWEGDFVVNSTDEVLVENCNFTVIEGDIFVYGNLTFFNSTLKIKKKSNTRGIFCHDFAKFNFNSSKMVGWIGLNIYDNAEGYISDSKVSGCLFDTQAIIHNSIFEDVWLSKGGEILNSTGQEVTIMDSSGLWSAAIADSDVDSICLYNVWGRDLSLPTGYVENFESTRPPETELSNITIMRTTIKEWSIVVSGSGYVNILDSDVALIRISILYMSPIRIFTFPSGYIEFLNVTIENNLYPLTITNSTVDKWRLYVNRGKYGIVASGIHDLVVGQYADVTVDNSSIWLLSLHRVGGNATVLNSAIDTVQLGSSKSNLTFTLKEGHHEEFNYYREPENSQIRLINVRVNHWGIIGYGNASVNLRDSTLTGPFAIKGVFFSGMWVSGTAQGNIVNSTVDAVACSANSVLNVRDSTINEVRAYDNSTLNAVNSTLGPMITDPPTINLTDSTVTAEICLLSKLPDESLLSCAALVSCSEPLPTSLKAASKYVNVSAQFKEPLEAQIRIFYDTYRLNLLGIRENDLRMYYLNTGSTIWEFCEIQGTNLEHQYVWADVTQFACFVIAAESSSPQGSGLVSGRMPCPK